MCRDYGVVPESENHRPVEPITLPFIDENTSEEGTQATCIEQIEGGRKNLGFHPSAGAAAALFGSFSRFPSVRHVRKRSKDGCDKIFKFQGA